jgi:hypothetical protein
MNGTKHQTFNERRPSHSSHLELLEEINVKELQANGKMLFHASTK